MSVVGDSIPTILRPLAWRKLPQRREKLPLRRSTIEVHPDFSEAPHLRSSIPLHLNTDFSKNQIAMRIIRWSESTKRFFIEMKIVIRTIWG